MPPLLPPSQHMLEQDEVAHRHRHGLDRQACLQVFLGIQRGAFLGFNPRQDELSG